MNKILIVGASGYLGQALTKELSNYFDVYGTYCHQTQFSKNKRFFAFDFTKERSEILLESLRPHIIIACVRGPFEAQLALHFELISFTKNNPCRLLIFSSANVFDAFSNYPSYEHDKTLSESVYGRFKIKIENALMRLPKNKGIVARVPMLFGPKSPRILQIKTLLNTQKPIEIFPNLIINVASDRQLTRQIHYMLNRKKGGLFHLGSKDLIHHDEWMHRLVFHLEAKNPVYKHIFTTNQDRYLAVLPRDNALPKHLQYGFQDILDDIFRRR